MRADASGRFSLPAWSLRFTDLQGLHAEVAAYAPGWSEEGRRPGAGARPTPFLGWVGLGRIEVAPQDVRLTMSPFRGSAADRHPKNALGRTPLAQAGMMALPEIAALLREQEKGRDQARPR